MNQQNTHSKGHAQYEGVPSGFGLTEALSWVQPQISEHRFKHTKGVVAAGKQIALACKIDPFLAELSAWLHDSCKEYKEHQLLEMAEKFHLDIDDITRAHPHLLHGPVAAARIKTELGITNKDVHAAISEHTLGNAPMCLLSKILFLADCIDETRSVDYTAPIWKALDIDDQINLDKAIYTACNLNLAFLAENNKPIHPRTILVRDYYFQQLNQTSSI